MNLQTQARPALSKVALVGALVVVVIVAAFGAYLFIGPPADHTSSHRAILKVTAIPPSLLISPGQVQNYSTIQVAENGSEVIGPVSVRAFSPTGVTIVLNQSSVTLSSSPQRIPVVIEAKTGITVGNYSVTIETSGQGIAATNQSIRIDVVPVLVLMRYPTFYPQNISVAKGTAVTWLNLNGYITCCDPGEHDVSFLTGGNYTSPLISTFQTVAYTFNADGVFEYYCTIHPIMKGQVTVSG